MRQPRIFRNLALLMVAVALTAGGFAARLIETPHRFPVAPDGKTYFGVQLDSEFDTVAGYASRLGSTPAVYGRYVDFPLGAAEEGQPRRLEPGRRGARARSVRPPGRPRAGPRSSAGW